MLNDNGSAYDKRVQEIKAHPDIAGLTSQCPQQLQESLQICIANLAEVEGTDQETLVQAIKKHFSATSSGRFNLFISYKRSQHKDLAEMLRRTLQGLSGGKISVFLDEYSIDAGQKWYDAIVKQLQTTNCLLLLVPDDIVEREWLIFEAGLFLGRMLPGDRLICLHHAIEQMPRQLVPFKGYSADPSGAEMFLRRVLVDRDLIPGFEPINPAAEPFLPEHALKISELFTRLPRLSTRGTMNFLELELNQPGKFKDANDLLECTITAGRGIEEMFAYVGRLPCKLSEALGVVDGVMGRHNVWLEELTESIRNEVAHRRAEVPFAKFSTDDGRKSFRPILGQIEEDEGRVAYRLKIFFGEHPIGIRSVPDDLEIIEAALRLASRMRGEILTRWSKPRKPEDVDQIERIMKRIERESHDEGFRDPGMLVPLFDGEDATNIKKMYKGWEQFRNESGKGKLDEAFATRDPVRLGEALREIRKLNHDFLVMATRRYAEMLGPGSRNE